MGNPSIAIDARELIGRPTGAGRYLHELLTAWATLPDASAHEFILCAPEQIDTAGLSSLRVSMHTAPGRGTWWEQRTLPGLVRRSGADVLFAPAYTAPLACRVPVVLAMHDVSFAAHPEWFGWREGLRRRAIAGLSARRAARVVTISAFSKGEIVRHLRVDPARIDVIYPGTTRLTAGAAPGVAREPLVLYVGSIFNRRHVPALIEAFTHVAARVPGARLDIVGDNRTRPRLDIHAEAARAATGVRVRDYVADAELADLYARASAFAFLSEYEGFGLTPLEALAAGVPIVVLDTPVAREVYGPAALYVERPEPARIAEALGSALLDPDARARVLAAAPGVLARYSWEACARQTLQLLQAC